MRLSPLVCLFLFLLSSPVYALEKVTLQLKWLHHFQFAGYYAALDKGFYKEAGLDVLIREGGPTTEVEQEVLSGKADFGIGTSALLLHRAKGEDLVVVGQIFQHSPAIFLTPRKSGIGSVAEMAGRRFMYSNQHGDMLALLKLNGIDESSIVKIDHHGDAHDLITDKADVMIAYSFNEPFVLEHAGEPYRTFSPRASGIDFYGDNFFTTRKQILEKPEVVKAFREATIKGWQYALHNKNEIVNLILARYSHEKSMDWLMFEANQIDTLIQPDLIELGYQNLSRWEKIADTFINLGMIPKGFDAKGIIYAPKQKSDYRLALVIVLIAGIIIVTLSVIALSFRRLNSLLKSEITERKHAELEREQSEGRYRTLFETSSTGIILVDRTGVIRFANQRMASMFGCRMEELIDSTYSEHVHSSQRGICDENFIKIIDKDIEYLDFDRRYLREDGNEFWGHFSGRYHEDTEGISIFVYGHIADITDRIKAEEARKNVEMQLLQAQKLESLGVLAGGIAHDFNNILMVIMGNANLALMRIPESPATENLHQIEKAAARAADLAKQMLAYSGKGKFVVEQINLNHLLEEMLHLLKVSISKKAIIRLNFAENLATVNADATQIRQIIMNLVINASESIGADSGVIDITTGCMDCDRSYLNDISLDGSLAEGLYVYLEITDTGCGMDKLTMAKLFDPFFTTKFTGRGLGMSAVLGIVRGHLGAIKVRSELGKGTTFKILLPASNLPVELVNGQNVMDNWKGSGTVLLVDDEETIRDIGSVMLKELGFTSITASDGREALEIFKGRDDISFVILDLTMPEMDGEQCFRELHMLKPDVKVIISSGYSEQEVSDKFIGNRLVGFIEKPYTLLQLKEEIKKIG